MNTALRASLFALCFLGAAAPAYAVPGQGLLSAISHALGKVNDAVGSVGSVTEAVTVPDAATSADQVSHTVTNGIEMTFNPDTSATAVARFNSSLPVVDKVLGVVACAPTGGDNIVALRENGYAPRVNEADRALLERYVMPGAFQYINWIFAVGTPMQNMHYHNTTSCVAVHRIDVTMRALNAETLTVHFVATDSGETAVDAYTFIRNGFGHWKLTTSLNG